MRRLPCLTSAALAAAMALPADAQRAATPATARTLAPRPGPSAPFHPQRLERIDQWIEGLVAAKQIPGAVAMLVKDGEVVYHKSWGVRELGKPEAMTPDDIFRIASQTKAITSLAAMMLWEEGKFALDDPVERYLPAFANAKVLTKFNPADSTFETRPATRRMTVRQLFTHTSGLDYADIGSDAFKAIYAKAGVTAMGRPGDILADRIDRLGALPLAAEPGERFTYSLSVDVLGRLVEVWSGMPLDQFFRNRIFVPLRMPDTGFELRAPQRTRLVALHQMVRGTLRAARAREEEQVTYFAGGAGLLSTTADYARFLQLFINGGELDGIRLLGRKTIEMMLTNQVGNLQPAFGLGFALETVQNDARSPVTLGTFSWGGAFNTTYWADPAERLVGLIYTNTTGAAPALGDPFKVLVYSALR